MSWTKLITERSRPDPLAILDTLSTLPKKTIPKPQCLLWGGYGVAGWGHCS